MRRALNYIAFIFGTVAIARAADTVILLHGLGRSPLAMARLAHGLRTAGYEVRNLAYPSQHAEIRTLADATLSPIFADNTSTSSASVREKRGQTLFGALDGRIIYYERP